MLKPWLLAIRPKTLAASVSPILLGSALAYHDGLLQPLNLWLALICALCLQIAVNLANDWFDGRSGVDTALRQGPIRVTQAGLMSPFQLLLGLGLVSALAIASGLWLVALSSWGLLAFGLAALLAVFAYSGGPWPLASHALGEVTVLLFFGWLAVGGSYYVHALQINPVVLGFGTVAGLISAAIMLVNNIRDIATDRPANKHTLAVVLGDNRARQLYIGLLITAVVGHLVISFPLGLVSLIPVLMMAPFLRRLVGAIRVRQGAGLNLQLAQTAQLLLLYCLAMSAVLVVF